MAQQAMKRMRSYDHDPEAIVQEKGRQSWIEFDTADGVECGIASVSHAVPTPPLDPQPSQLDVSYLRFELPVNATVMIGDVHLLDSDHTVIANDQVMHHGGSLCAIMSQTVVQSSCSFGSSYDQGAHIACTFGRRIWNVPGAGESWLKTSSKSYFDMR